MEKLTCLVQATRKELIMAITMYQADRNFVSPSNDASLYSAINGDTSGVIKRANQLKMTVNGLTVTIQTGSAIVLGRLVEITSPETLVLPANSSGSICIVVDLSKTNEVSGNAGDVDYSVTVNQVNLSTVTGTLTQENINDGGFIYELPLATFSSTATSATIKQNNPILNDTGWLDLDVGAVGARFSTDDKSHHYAQYRVRDNVVYIRWRAVDVGVANNKNQMANVPWSLRPDKEIIAAAVDVGTSSIYPAMAYINETATIWFSYVSPHGGYLCGSMSYPLTR